MVIKQLLKVEIESYRILRHSLFIEVMLSCHFHFVFIFRILICSIETGILKRKGKYVFLGLSGSGKRSLMRQLLEENLLDPMPYPHGGCNSDTNVINAEGEFLKTVFANFFNYV